MKYLFAILLAFAFVFGGMYLVISFIKWDFTSFGEWQEHQRAFLAFVGILLSCLMSAIFCGIADDIGRGK